MRDDDEEHPRRRGSSPRAGSIPAFSTMDECAAFFRRAQTEPETFALYMVRAQADRQHAILERLLLGSAAQADRVLASQLASSHALHEALQTLSRGANDIAVAGAGFFRGSLEGTARAAGMRHATELGKQRAGLVRDAMATSSGMVQEALAPPVDAGADAELEDQARRLLALISDDVIDELRRVAPSVLRLFQRLRAGPLTAARVRAAIVDAQDSVDLEELIAASQRFEAELSRAFGVLVVSVLSEGQT